MGVTDNLQEIADKLAALEETDAPPSVVKPCSLDKSTQALVKLIFNNDMFQEAMQSMEIGKLETICHVISYLRILSINFSNITLWW